MKTEERVADLLARSTPEFEAERLILDATELIIGLMERERVTRTQLARRIRKSKGHVSQILNGERNMTLRTLAEIAHSLQYRIHIDARPVDENRDEEPKRPSHLRTVLDVIHGGDLARQYEEQLTRHFAPSELSSFRAAEQLASWLEVADEALAASCKYSDQNVPHFTLKEVSRHGDISDTDKDKDMEAVVAVA